MHVARIRGALSLVVLAVAAACGSSEPSGPNASTPSAIARVSGNGQVGLVGTSLSLPLIVKVTGTSGAPIKGATVTFAVPVGPQRCRRRRQPPTHRDKPRLRSHWAPPPAT